MSSVITQRQIEILEKLIEEHIKTASPISSAFLKKKFRLKVCPATIRLDFAQLTQAGFLEKQYTSGGRVPTDKAYRFFVNRLLENGDFQTEEEKFLKELTEIFEKIDSILDLFHESAKALASFSSNLGVVFDQNFKTFWKEGWERIIKIPEFHDIDYLKKFTELVSDLEENIDRLDFPEETKKVKIYIGKESPFKRKEFCIVVGKGCVKRDRATFVILGPKRMDFKNNISLINSLIKKLETIS